MTASGTGMVINEARDRIQHHIIAALADIDDNRLIFKGGTLLRVCGLLDHRHSEDLDFDWLGPRQEFPQLIAAALSAAAASNGSDLRLAHRKGPNLSVRWPHRSYEEDMKAEATFLDSNLTGPCPVLHC